jgi:hypothetical protein
LTKIIWPQFVRFFNNLIRSPWLQQISRM